MGYNSLVIPIGWFKIFPLPHPQYLIETLRNTKFKKIQLKGILAKEM